MFDLFAISEWTLVTVLAVVLVFATEIGYRHGRKRSDRHSSDGTKSFQAHEVSALGVLALLLGFTFSLAGNRFETRREMIVNEANAIGTAALRGNLLPEPLAAQSQALFARYVDMRVCLFEAGIETEAQAAALKASEEMRQQMWRIAAEALTSNRLDVGAGLFADAVNTVIDLHGARKAASSYHLPDAIFLLLISVAILAFALSGIAAGYSHARSRMPTLILVVLVCAVALFIIDLDRPQRGLLMVNDQSMRELADMIKMPQPDKPTPAPE